jgi:hypothetical protein
LWDGMASLKRFETVVEGFIEAIGSRSVLIDMLGLKCRSLSISRLSGSGRRG